MVIRNGIRSILRSGKLCFLFFLLTAAVSLLLVSGSGIYVSSSAQLASFSETYQTVGRIEYIGSEYPDENALDPYAEEAYGQLSLNELEKTAGVLRAEKKNIVKGYTEGFHRYKSQIPYKNYGVLILTSVHSPTMQEETVYLDDVPEFPDTYTLKDDVTGTVTFCHDGRAEEIPCFIYDSMTQTYTRILFGDGVYHEEEYTEAELPVNRYIRSSISSQPVLTYYGDLNPEDPGIPHYVYDRNTNRYSTTVSRMSGYIAYLSDALYSRTNDRNVLIHLRTGEVPFTAEEGRTYAVHGSFVDGNTSNLVFEIRPFENNDTLPIADITGMERESLKETVFGEYADFYEEQNNYLNISFSQDISLLEPFHQGYLVLKEGRYPKKGEDNVCVIDGLLAGQLNLKPGDTLPLHLNGTEESFVITGITEENQDYEGEVFAVSKNAHVSSFSGYQLGYVQFDNEKASSASEKVRELLPEGCRLTVYDQGYESNSQPLKALRLTSLIIMGISLTAAISILILFAFLYVYRQAETADTLRRLGCDSKEVRLWMGSGCCTVAAAGSLCGSIAAALCRTGMIRYMVSAAKTAYGTDTRYSEAAVGLIKKSETVIPGALPEVILCIVFCTLLSYLLSCLFLRLSERNGSLLKGNRMTVPGNTLAGKGNTVLRYGITGFIRGGKRTRAVILITMVLAGVLCGFSSLKGSWQNDLDALYQNTQIRGSVISLNGRYLRDLAIPESFVRKLNHSGNLKELHVSYSHLHYWVDGEMPLFSSTSFGEESRDAWISKQPKLVFTDVLRNSEDFLYQEPVISWEEGADESLFQKEYPLVSGKTVLDEKTGREVSDTVYPAVVSDAWARGHGTGCGEDTVIMTEYGLPLRIHIAGTYAKTGAKANIYLPLAAVFELKYLSEDRETVNTPYYRTMEQYFTSCGFVLDSAVSLKQFKDYLSSIGCSAVNQPESERIAVVLYDSAFLDTLGSLERHIRFMDMLMPLMMGLTVLAGFLISWLMINGRRMDFAVMKGLGADGFTVFMIFFMEQAAAAAAGILPVLLVSLLSGGTLLLIGFGLSYLLGTACAILLAGRENLMVLLSEKE